MPVMGKILRSLELRRGSRALYDVYVESVPSYYAEYVYKVYGDPEFPKELWDARMELESLGLQACRLIPTDL
jgi:hypothetical protein